MATIYSLLNKKAKAWWYHRDLRKAGNVEEARKRERASIRSAIETLRGAKVNGHFNVGRGGWGISYSYDGGSTTLSGYGGIEAPEIQCAIKLGIPGWDSTVVPDDKIWDTLKFPLCSNGNKVGLPPYGSFDYAPLARILELYESIGANIFNA